MVQIVVDIPVELMQEVDEDGWANNLILQLLKCGDNKMRYFLKKDQLVVDEKRKKP